MWRDSLGQPATSSTVWPSRETALHLIDLLRDYDNRDRIDFALADRCYEIYGYPELSPDALSRFVVEASMRPLVAVTPSPADEPKPVDPITYGLTPKS